MNRSASMARQIKAEVQKGIGRGMSALRVFLTARLRETVSVSAPRKLVKNPHGGTTYRSLSKAIRGLPPRLVTGTLKFGIQVIQTGPYRLAIGSLAKGGKSSRFPHGFPYPLYHEKKIPMFAKSGRHPWIQPTIHHYRREILKILAKAILPEVQAK